MNSLQVHKTDVATTKTLWDAAGTVYCSKDFKKLLLTADASGKHILHTLAYTEGPEQLKFLISEIKGMTDEEEFKAFLVQKDFDGQNSFEITAKSNKNSIALRNVFAFYEEIFSEQELVVFLNEFINNPLNLRAVTQNDEKVFEEVWDIVTSKISKSDLQQVFNNLEFTSLSRDHIRNIY